MRLFWFLFYNVLILPFLFLFFNSLRLFNSKIKMGLAGKKRSLKTVEKFCERITDKTPLIVFHCASLGEYEQIKPVLKVLSETDTAVKKIVSFFSPSGYNNMDENPNVDLKIYLPIDSIRSVNSFLTMTKPILFVISKHDIWPNIIWALSNRKIPILLINGTMPADSFMTKPFIRSFYRSVLSCFQFIAAASEMDKSQFKKIVNQNVDMEVLGDTRYDQVHTRSLESKKKHLLPREYFEDKIMFIAGSTWPSDEEHLFPALLKLLEKYLQLYLIIVPHEPDRQHLLSIQSFFEENGYPSFRFSEGNFHQQFSQKRILVVDRIGILANLYSYGHIAYVGGSFSPGVHNVMEPAAFHIPVLFGPKILNSPEAQELVRREAGFKVENWNDIIDISAKLCENEPFRIAVGSRSGSLVDENRGATEKIVQKIIHTFP